MTPGTRFHLDQDGHSVTVQLEGGQGAVELLVDGKAVAHRAVRGEGLTVMTGELPGDPPRAFGVTVGDMGGELFCALEIDGASTLMPQVPLSSRSPEPSGPARPLRNLRRSLRRVLRRL
ncbi:hypothetical protein [Streptomyces sp. NPDC059176]|uniref:hypothetical protein n=1 Tax=unclassified Streptomyces TaxID=2593676 RepID=UPI0036D0BD67